jgi:hypothetical protein
VGDASSDPIESTDGLRGRLPLPLPLLACATTALFGRGGLNDWEELLAPDADRAPVLLSPVKD